MSESEEAGQGQGQRQEPGASANGAAGLEAVRVMPWTGGDVEPLVSREWLVTNGLGGYASGTISGVATRRYHGLLIAALPAPHGRSMMLAQLGEQLTLADGRTISLGGQERVGDLAIPGAASLRELRLELGLPVWRYDLGGGVWMERRLLMLHRQNTVHLGYRITGGAATLRLRPMVHFRGHDEQVGVPLGGPYRIDAVEGGFEISIGSPEVPAGREGSAPQAAEGLPADPARRPPLRLTVSGAPASLAGDKNITEALRYRIEEDRGYEHVGELWSPGELSVPLADGAEVTLIASTEGWPAISAQPPHQARLAEVERRRTLIGAARGPAAELIVAADAFIITPAGRAADVARAGAAGDEIRSVIAGYHWFTDWGRDTMISLEGLTLSTGRLVEAGYILRTFAGHEKDGLIPNLFPEGQDGGVYHTADATLWFFHALARYVRATGDRQTLRGLLPRLHHIVRKHLEGTRFGIRVDPADGLLRQGEVGYQLTWMDAKCGDWVVTPRRGKAVEINALWFNALKLLEGFSREEGDAAAADRLAAHAGRARVSFNRRFWNEAQGCLFDVVDVEGGGDDAAIRPNQIFAVSLDHPVLDEGRRAAVLEVVRRELLTPVGLRSLSRGHPDYKPDYHGDLLTRDAAYHQGTVWSWLIGPFVDAHLRVHPGDRAGARALLQGLIDHLGEGCLGQVAEVFDAEPPFTPRGCIAQAWGVAELLRSLRNTGDPQ